MLGRRKFKSVELWFNIRQKNLRVLWKLKFSSPAFGLWSYFIYGIASSSYHCVANRCCWHHFMRRLVSSFGLSMITRIQQGFNETTPFFLSVPELNVFNVSARFLSKLNEFAWFQENLFNVDSLLSKDFDWN